MGKIILQKEHFWNDKKQKEKSFNAHDVRAIHVINFGLTVNLKNGQAIGYRSLSLTTIFAEIAKALSPEEASQVKMSLNNHTYLEHGVHKRKFYGTLDEFKGHLPS
jgi:hypothetical protein